jgi:hypothetical protein
LKMKIILMKETNKLIMKMMKVQKVIKMLLILREMMRMVIEEDFTCQEDSLKAHNCKIISGVHMDNNLAQTYKRSHTKVSADNLRLVIN